MPAPYLDHPPTAAGPSPLPSSANIVCGSISVFAGQEELLEGQPGLGPLKAKMDIENSIHSHQAFARVVPPSTSTVLPLHLTPRSVSGLPVALFPQLQKGPRGSAPHYRNDRVACGAVIATHGQNKPGWEATWAVVGVATPGEGYFWMLRHLGSRQLNSHPCSASSWLDHMASSSPSLSPSFPSVQWAAQDTSSSGGPFLFCEALQAWPMAAAGPGCQMHVLAHPSLLPPSVFQLWGWQLGPSPGQPCSFCLPQMAPGSSLGIH